MVHTQDADSGDILQMWRAATNVLNTDLQTADRGGPPAWELDGGSKQIPSVKTKFVVKHYMQPWTWMDSLA
jgi:hypothetical protein